MTDSNVTDVAEAETWVANAVENGELDNVFAWESDRLEVLMNRYATAFIGNLSRPEGADDVWIDAVADRYNVDDIASLLRYGNAEARRLGTLLEVVQLFAHDAKALARYVKDADTKLPEMSEEIWLAVLESDLATGHDIARPAVASIVEAVTHFADGSWRVGRTARRECEAFKVRTEALLKALDVEDPVA